MLNDKQYAKYCIEAKGMPPRSKEEIELAEDVYMQLHKLGLESLLNLLASVVVEIERRRPSKEQKNG
jgi:hypothetical protein